MATPSGASLGVDVDDSQLLFMTHAPGALVPPRAERDETEESVADRILGPFLRKRGPAAAPEPAQDQSFVGRLSEGAGRDALRRAREASQRAAQQRYKPPPLDQTLAGASKHVRQEVSPKVVVAGPAAPTAAPSPSFLAQVPGALLSPLRGFPVLAVQAFLLGLGLLLLEVALPLGAIALGLGLTALLALRVRGIRDAAAGEDRIVWPALSEMLTAAPLYGAALLAAFGPAAVAAAVAWGEPGRDGGPASVQARLRHVLAAPAEPAAGEAPARREPSTLGRLPLRALEALVAAEPAAAERAPGAIARDLQQAALARARALVRVDPEAPLGLAARALLLVGLVAFPMGLLAAVRLRSAYAAAYPPIIVRSALRVLGPYLLVVAATAAQAAALLASLFLLPSLLRDELGPGPGHLAWVAIVAALATGGAMALSALQGRLYRTRRPVLGWD